MDEIRYWMMDEDGYHFFTAKTPDELYLDIARRKAAGYVFVSIDRQDGELPDLRMRPRPRREDL